ncbi:hypothetical protein GQ651_02515 [Alphaproteobacteria bacterium GH1-50]|uniref:Uncharacterized protein n=1 Tax=Kangsaoukella pontilimi TaxID=2691042 RepID=A0A7C9MBW5_9RHOB|nr:hypothetical protein [Kangsaoukella pontilimi]MXQ06712.1 hypothetical protein [Kangsaoukella pontilimi]
MIRTEQTGKGPALAGALFLSGCDDPSPFHDTYYVVTRPIELLTGYLLILCLILAAWWVILRFAQHMPKRGLTLVLALLAGGFLLSALPTLMLVTGVLWPSVTVILQLAGLGGALILLALAATAVVFVWTVIHALSRRG